jgi:epoxyqueuosine reductase
VTLVALALSAAVKARALELGFDRVAIGPAGPPEHGAQLEEWLDAGYAGTMRYLDRGRADRLDPARLLPGCRAVVAVAVSYNLENGATPPSSDWRPVSRYARGRDYHDIMRPRLVELGDFIRAAAGAGVTSRAAVDSSAVLERDLAARAGLGWIGKNTNLLTPSLGSYFFIGIVSYLTIEHRGDIPGELCDGLGEWLFGCDVCQDVCPWNRKAEPARDPALRPSGSFGPLESLFELDRDAFHARFRGTALARTKRAGLLRNAAIVLANRGERRAVGALSRALGDEDAGVRRAAAGALEKLGAGGASAS